MTSHLLRPNYIIFTLYAFVLLLRLHFTSSIKLEAVCLQPHPRPTSTMLLFTDPLKHILLINNKASLLQVWAAWVKYGLRIRTLNSNYANKQHTTHSLTLLKLAILFIKLFLNTDNNSKKFGTKN